MPDKPEWGAAGPGRRGLFGAALLAPLCLAGRAGRAQQQRFASLYVFIPAAPGGG